MNEYLPIATMRAPISGARVGRHVRSGRRGFYRRALGLAMLWLMSWYAVSAEQLPTKAYTTAEGLLADGVVRVVSDGRGFIWFCTLEGLSRFDGYGFTNYTTADGLPDRHVYDLLITRRGDYWIATGGGLVRLNPKGLPPQRNNGVEGSGVPLFVSYQPDDNSKAKSINVLFEDEAGVVWVGTDGGLYQLVEQSGQVRFRAVAMGEPESGLSQNVLAITKDRSGALWVGTEAGGLFRLLPDGRSEQYTTRNGLLNNHIRALLVDHQGRLWAGSVGNGGLLLITAEPDTNRSIVARFYSEKDGLPTSWVTALYQAADGRLWVATTHGLCEVLLTGADGHATFRVYDESSGLCGDDLSSVAEDRDGNLWVASMRCGATKIARYGFTRFTTGDGLNSTNINSIFENQTGDLFVSTNTDKGRVINRLNGSKFTAVRPPVPARALYGGWGWGQIITQDHLGDWWVATGMGLFRFPQPSRFEQLARTPAQEVEIDRLGKEIFRLYEDSRGDIWVATTGDATELKRWERATDTWHDYTQSAGFSAERTGAAFREDRAGNLWIGTGGDDSALLRYRDDQMNIFTHRDGAPQGWLKDLYLDHAGRLWIASNVDGLIRIDDPSAARPQFVAYTMTDGLSSNNVLSVTEDSWGRIYAGTGRGLDELNPQTGRIKHYTAADGLPNGRVDVAFRDRQGALWFGTSFGLARLLPEPQRPRHPPTILITGLRVAGLARPVSILGEADISQLTFSPTETQVSIDLLGLGANLGEELRYEYKLEGTGADWTQTNERTINFANLKPGAYRLLVRALSVEGVYSQTPAIVAFNIAAPIWQRWWFIALVIFSIGGLASVLYRYRVARLLEVANMRTRIATDLHDDIGANLTKIAILSEVIKQQHGNGDVQPNDPLSAIARISRESVAAMGDIVWAINPERDSLRDLVRRMRRHAEELTTLRNIGLTFNAPATEQHLKLSVDMRRDLFLIFKEAVNNTARHSRCTQVIVALSIAGTNLALEVADNGVGFDTTDESDGQGLMSMRRRATNLGGELTVESAAGQGTRVRLSVHHARGARAERRTRSHVNP